MDDERNVWSATGFSTLGATRAANTLNVATMKAATRAGCPWITATDARGFFGHAGYNT